MPAKNSSGWRRLRRYFACGYFQFRRIGHAGGLMTRDEGRGLLLILLILLMLLIVIGNDAAVEEEPRELQWIHCAVPDQEKCPLCRARPSKTQLARRTSQSRERRAKRTVDDLFDSSRNLIFELNRSCEAKECNNAKCLQEWRVAMGKCTALPPTASLFDSAQPLFDSWYWYI